MTEKFIYTNDGLSVDFYPNLLGEKLAGHWYEYIDYFVDKDNKRSTMMLGDSGVVYSVKYPGVNYSEEVAAWDEIPALQDLKGMIEKMTDQKYTVCAIMRYPDGKVGIAPHKDKEMVAGTRICGLSLGATRSIEFSRPGYESFRIKLPSGSLYVMNPPTNQFWKHAIVKETKVKEPRISLTFRDYR